MIGARLKQARLFAGLTQKQLAERLCERDYLVTAAAVSKYEKGKSVPPAQFLLLASSELNVLSTYFSHQPTNNTEWKSFRRHSNLGKKKQEVVKGHAADLAELQVELYSLLYPDKSPELPAPVSVNSFEEAEQVANTLRAAWKLDSRPLDNLIQTSEDKGVIVIGWDKSNRFDGLSGWCGDFPVAVVNTGKSVDRTRFNLAHELGHLLMDTSKTSPKKEERLAHRFAAAFLVPEDDALRELGARRDQLDWGEIKMLKRKYGLSMAAWLMRARDLAIISENRYSEMIKDFSSRGWRKNEPEQYRGDEEPIQLQQMASRAVAEGLVSPDRITRVCASLLESNYDKEESGHLTVYDLLKMPEAERKAVIERAFALAAEEEFEILEAFDAEDFNDESF